MNRILGIINLHNEKDLGEITLKRSLGSLTFLGRYSFCDIPLSNFGNSKINSTVVLVKKNIRSIIKHIDDSRVYSENSKLGSSVTLFNERSANSDLYNTDINNLLENKWIFDENDFDYVVIAPTHMIYRLNFQDVIHQHQLLKSEITVCYKKIKNGKKEFTNSDAYLIDENNHLRGIYVNKGTENEINVSMETYVINTTKFLEILDFANRTSQFFTLRDVLKYICTTLDIDTFEYQGYLKSIDSLSSYLKCSLELLDSNVLNQLMNDNWPINTKTHDTPPARYLEHAEVTNSFISNGAIIDGKVENSVICRSVKISKNAIIKNSIILSDSIISDGVRLENVIVDKNCKIIHVKSLKGSKNRPIYIKQGDIV